MNRRRAKRRAAERRLAEEIIRNQVEPQLAAQRWRDAGADVQVELVTTHKGDLDGWVEITCSDCGRTARLPAERAPSPAMTVLCPGCVAELGNL